MNRVILAIDPGPEQSAWLLWDGKKVMASGIETNTTVLARLESDEWGGTEMYIEMIASYGMAVGKSVFETVFWVGRFCQAWRGVLLAQRVMRMDVKMHLCHSARAKDGNIRAALIDRCGAVGTKAQPGPLRGVKSHLWAALAVAVYAFDQK